MTIINGAFKRGAIPRSHLKTKPNEKNNIKTKTGRYTPPEVTEVGFSFYFSHPLDLKLPKFVSVIFAGGWNSHRFLFSNGEIPLFQVSLLENNKKIKVSTNNLNCKKIFSNIHFRGCLETSIPVQWGHTEIRTSYFMGNVLNGRNDREVPSTTSKESGICA